VLDEVFQGLIHQSDAATTRWLNNARAIDRWSDEPEQTCTRSTPAPGSPFLGEWGPLNEQDQGIGPDWLAIGLQELGNRMSWDHGSGAPADLLTSEVAADPLRPTASEP
jgi:hypothetical protein